VQFVAFLVAVVLVVGIPKKMESLNLLGAK